METYTETRNTMGRYETTIKIAQIQKLVEERKYKKAAAVLSTLDVHQIRSKADLRLFAEVYVKTEQFEAAKAIYLRLYKRSHTKRILYRLIYLAIRTNDLEEAEAFYDEFVSVSHSSRDNLILRYRIDKAKGVPIGQLIDTLEVLKEEEYIEEWAYELAKLYQRAGRKEECRQECQDIRLWFGQGEIVDRAEMLLEYLDEGKNLYYTDKDYTVKEKEEPNPDDTGSLPDLGPEMMKREKERLKQLRREEKEKQAALREQEEEFVDDYEEEEAEDDDMTMEPGELAQMAKEGLQKLTGFWKRGNKQEAAAPVKVQEKAVSEVLAEAVKSKEEKKESVAKAEKPVHEAATETADDMPDFQQPKQKAGILETGITQDLAKEISAIFEMEKRGQLKEKAVTVVNEVPNVAVNVVDRMSQAINKKAGKTYIPLDIETEEETEETTDVEESAGPDGMEEIQHIEEEIPPQATVWVPKNDYLDGEDEVTMIELDQIMPEPDMPELKQVMPEDSPEFGKQPELEDKDLPTTRALHNSFDDMLTLIAGEREPKHFVLIGEGEERILGITSKIVRVMNKKKFLSTNRIARISAEKLNEMELLKVCSQIKGNCLLIDGAANLQFPTITKIFAVMDAFKGDFMVVLADDGDTLDELFKVAPALARRFEYVIDTTQYDLQEIL